MTDQSLITRLREAEGASRELDKQIWQLLVPDVTRRTSHVAHHSKPYDIDETRDASGRLIIVPSYTASLDAALALVAETVKPIRVSVHDHIGGASAEIVLDAEREFTGNTLAASPAIALLIAILRAQGETE